MSKRHDFERNFAIIIGINEYKTERNRLRLAVPDAEVMGKILSSPDRGEDEIYEVLLLKNEQATESNLRKLLNGLKEGKIYFPEATIDLKETHRLLLYFTGHGYASNLETSQPEQNEQYLLSQDEKKLPMQELTNTLGQLPCRHVLLILDCCYSGAVRRVLATQTPVYRTASMDDDEMSFRADYDRMLKRPTFTVITSAGYELALDKDKEEQQNSYFAIALRKALECNADSSDAGAQKSDFNKDGIITAHELCTYLQSSPQVISRQLPQIYSLTSSKERQGGQYVFLLPDFDPSRLAEVKGLESPYKGLLSYEQKDAPIFFGRKRFINDLFERVYNKNKKLTVVAGASGSGKSSLVKAGLISQLTRENASRLVQSGTVKNKKSWVIGEFRPGNSPFMALFDALKESLGFEDINNLVKNQIEAFHEKLGEYARKRKRFGMSVKTRLDDKEIKKETKDIFKKLIDLSKVDNDTNLLLFIDQFEELVTLSHASERELFLKLLKQMLDESENLRLVLTVRADFEVHFRGSSNRSDDSKANTSPDISQYWNEEDTRFYINEIKSHELKQVIERPAALFYVDFESDKLVSQMIEQVLGMPGALPLLSFTLDELYQRAKDTPSKRITQEHYNELGGVVKALTTRANQEYEIKEDEDKSAGELRQEMMKLLMLRMVSLQGGQLAKRPVPLSELEYPKWGCRHKNATEQIKKVREQLEAEKCRLIVTGKEYTEPAHDALILHWDKLREWIEQEKDNLVLHNRLIIAVQDWQEREHQKQKNPIVLVLNPVGYALGCVTEQLMRFGFWNFQLRNRILQWLNPLTLLGHIKSQINPQTTAVPTSAAGKLGGHLWHNEPRLEQLRKFLYAKNSWLNASETEFVRRSVIWKGTWNFFWSILGWVILIIIYALAAWALFEGRKAQIKSAEALRESAEANLKSERQLDAALDILKAQKTLDSIWDWEIPPEVRSSVQGTFFKLFYGTQERNRLQLDRGSVYKVVYNPNPQQEQLATVGKGDTVRLWNSKGDELAPLITDQKSVYSVAFRYDPNKPDRTLLATGGADGTVKFWDIQKDGSSTSCAISSVNKNNPPCSIETIDLAKGKKNIDIDDIEFSADGTLLAIIEHNFDSQDHHVKLCERTEEKGKTTYNCLPTKESEDQKNVSLGQENVYPDIAFMPQEIKIQGKNSTVLATVVKNDVVKLWNVTSGKKLGEINTQQGYVYSVAFNNDGILMTGGADGTVKRWQIKTPDSSNKVEIVPTTPQEIKTDQTKNVYSITVGHDGKLATVGENEIVQRWNSNGNPINPPIQPLEGSLSDSKTRSVAFRPDGERLATIGGDNTIRLWDTAGKRIRRFNKVPEQIENVVFSPDGKLLATVGTRPGSNSQEKKNIIRLWDAGSGEEIDYDDAAPSNVKIKSLVFLPKPPNNQQLPWQPIAAINEDGIVGILFSNLNNFQLVRERVKETVVEGKVVRETVIENCKLEENCKLYYRTAGQFYPNYGSIKIENLTFSANFNYEALIYTDTKNKDDSRKLIKLKKKYLPVVENASSVALSGDGQRFAMAKIDGVVQVWDTDKLLANLNTFPDKPDIELQTQQDNIAGLAFYPSDNDRLVTGGADGTVRLWDLSRNKPTQLPLLRDGELKTATASADGQRLATLSNEGILKLWDVEGGTLKASPLLVNQLNESKQELKEAETIALSSTGKYIAIIEKDGSVLLWNTEKDNRADFIPANQNDKAISIEFAPDDTRLVAIRKSGRIEVWKLGEDGQLSQDLDKQANQPIPLLNTNRDRLNNEQDIVSASFNPKNSSALTTLYADTIVLATLGKNGTVKLWNAKDEHIGTFKTDQKEPHIIAFSPDGTRLATGATEGNKTEGTVRVWDTKGKQIRQFGVRLEDVKSITFSNDAQKLAIVAKGEKESSKENDNNQENFRVFDVNDESRQPINPSNTQQGTIVNAMFTSDGQLATLSTNGRLSLWRVGESKLREGVCQLVWNYLNSNPTVKVKEDIGDLCGNVDEPMEQRFSAGEKLLIHSNPSPEKLAGIKAFANGDLDTAIKKLQASLSKPNDPEALIYLNNARIGALKSYTIAVPVPITSNPNGAVEILRGVAQAQDKINRTGGINGVALRVLIADDQGDEKAARKLAQHLADNPDVLGVVGHFASNVTHQAGEIYKQKQLVAISPISTAVNSAWLLNSNAPIFGNPYLFRTVPNDRQSAQALARYLWEQLKHEKAVVFFNSSNEYSKSLSSEFEKAFRGRGGQVVQTFDVSKPDFNPTQRVQDAINSGAQALVLLTDTSQLDATLQVVKANGSLSRQQNRQPLSLLAGDDIYTLKTLQEGKADADGMTVAVPGHIDSNPVFAEAANSLWGATVNWRTAMAYDATQAFIEALRQNCNPQETKDARECIAQRLHSKDFSVSNGASGQIQFDQSGDRRIQESQLVKVVQSGSNSRSRTGYDFQVVGQLPLTGVEQNKIQPRPQNVPSPTPSSNNGQSNYSQAPNNRNQASKLNSVNAYINQGLTYHRQRNYQQAIRSYSKAIALNPNSAKAYSNRAAAYNEQKDYPKAIADSSKAISLNPTYANAYINRGLAYYRQGNYQQAIANYNKAIELDSYNANAYHNRALAYTRLGNQPAAQTDKRKAAALSQRQSQ